MADVIRERHYVGVDDRRTDDLRRADDIRAHHRQWWQSNGLLLGMLGLLALALVSMFLYDRGRSARNVVVDEPARVAVPPPVTEAPELTPPPPPAPEPEKSLAPVVPIPEKVEEKAIETPKVDVEEKTIETPKVEIEEDVFKEKAVVAPQPRQAVPLTTELGAQPMLGGCKRLDIYFQPQGMTLTDKEDKALDTLAACLKANPEMKVRLEGRTDAVEIKDAEKGTLAKDRARLIKDELKERGICPSRVKVESDLIPTCTNNDYACRRQNRSVTAISE